MAKHKDVKKEDAYLSQYAFNTDEDILTALDNLSNEVDEATIKRVEVEGLHKINDINFDLKESINDITNLARYYQGQLIKYRQTSLTPEEFNAKLQEISTKSRKLNTQIGATWNQKIGHNGAQTQQGDYYKYFRDLAVLMQNELTQLGQEIENRLLSYPNDDESNTPLLTEYKLSYVDRKLILNGSYILSVTEFNSTNDLLTEYLFNHQGEELNDSEVKSIIGSVLPKDFHKYLDNMNIKHDLRKMFFTASKSSIIFHGDTVSSDKLVELNIIIPRIG